MCSLGVLEFLFDHYFCPFFVCSSLCTCVFVLRRAQWMLNKLWCHVKGDSAVEEGDICFCRLNAVN